MIELTELRSTQLYELDLLKIFRAICECEKLRYFLVGGTAIGAIRHQGFIPWDDDVDVAMPREDYDKFLLVADKYLENNIKVLSFQNDEKYEDMSMKLVNTSISYVMKTDVSQIKQNVWIDIFPIDGTSSNKVIQLFHYWGIYFLRMQLAYYYMEKIQYNEERSGWKKLLIKIAQVIPVNKMINPRNVCSKIDKHLKRYPYETSAIVGNYLGAYKTQEFVNRDIFSNGIMKPFEDELFFVPKEYDTYLKHIYGNYMELPPEGKQKPKHSVIEIIYE